MLPQILIDEKSLPIFLTKKKLSALFFTFFRETSKNVICENFQRAITFDRVAIEMRMFLVC